MFWKKKTQQPAASLPALPGQSPPPLPAREPMRLGKGNPGIFDKPLNPLEEALIAARQRGISMMEFFGFFLNSSAYVLVPEVRAGESRGGSLTLSRDTSLFSITYPEYTCLCFYSSIERTKPTLEMYPDFKYAVKVTAGNLVSSLKEGAGLIINPYWDVNLEWTAEQVTYIRKAIVRD